MPVDKFGLTIQQTVALLLGAHSIGRSRVTPESDCSKGLNRLSATPDTFNNDYYTSAINDVNRVSNNGANW
jgi:hypothetical protein